VAPEVEVSSTLWPEHFDVAITINEVNYGGLGPDATIAAPYLYVGPPAVPADSAFWNAPFGAARDWSRIRTVDEAVSFFVEGRAQLGS
jgi:hypothetical protein